MKRTILLMALAATFAGCRNDYSGGSDGSKLPGRYYITAGEGEQTRTVMNPDGTMAWSEGDAIGVCLVGEGVENNFSFTLEDIATGTFAGNELTAGSDYIAYYPYRMAGLADGKIGWLPVEVLERI